MHALIDFCNNFALINNRFTQEIMYVSTIQVSIIILLCVCMYLVQVYAKIRLP